MTNEDDTPNDGVLQGAPSPPTDVPGLKKAGRHARKADPASETSRASGPADPWAASTHTMTEPPPVQRRQSPPPATQAQPPTETKVQASLHSGGVTAAPPQVAAPPLTPAMRPAETQTPELHPAHSLLQVAEEQREGIPAEYNDGIQWLQAGFHRHNSAVVVGMLFSWTGLWLAFWGALIGVFAGLLVGLGVGNTNIPVFSSFGLNQSVSVFTVVGGVFVGALGGFLFVVIFMVTHPYTLIGALVGGAIITVLIVIFTASFERLGLRMRGYRRLSRDEVRQIAPLVKSAADAMKLPALPRFAMANQHAPNAWTHMRTIVLTTGLLQHLEPKEVEAILAHELFHWRHGDSVGLQCMWAASLPAALVYNFGVLASGQRRSGQQDGIRVSVGSGFRWLIAWLIAWPSWIIVKVIIAPIAAASQRRYEYEADAAARDIGLAQPLISALTKISVFESGRTGWEAAMTANHPPTQLRIEALQAPRPDDWEYQEEELRGPSWREFRRIFFGAARPRRH